MSTPYTLMRSRMKDLISCFNSSKLPVDDDRDERVVHQLPKSSAIVDDRKREKGKKQVELQTAAAAARGRGDVESPASWKSCEPEEEDQYIVFYFKDEVTGGDVIQESSSSRNQVAVGNNRRKKRETGKNKVGAKWVSQEIEEIKDCDEHKDTLEESSDSSTSSFAFPAIQSEWTGSPVLMPRPEGNHDNSRNVNISEPRNRAGSSRGNGFFF